MPQDQCECQSENHGHECKNAVTHEDDRMCDYCHEKGADEIIQMLPPGK